MARLTYNSANENEYFTLLDNTQLRLNGNIKNASYGVEEFKSSLDYMSANFSGTESQFKSLSLAREQTLSYEISFDANQAQGVTNWLENNPLVFHLSPERGLSVPELSTSLLGGLGLLTLMTRRNRSALNR